MIHFGEAVLPITRGPARKIGPRDWACVSRMGGLGDNLIASSVLPGLKRRYGRVEVITCTPYDVVFENNPHIDKLTVYEKGYEPFSVTKTWNEYYDTLAKGYKFFVNLSHSCEATGVTMPVMTQFWWPEKARRKLFNRSYLEIAHDLADVPYEEIDPRFYASDEEREKATETLRQVGDRVVGWVISGSRLDKLHPEADVTVARIIRELNVPVVLFGAPGRDLEYAKLIQAEVKKRNRSLDGLHLALSPDPETPSWPVRRICATLQQCDIVVGPDTGPMWAVAMEEMPKVMLASHAGPTNVTKHWRNTTTLAADPERVPCFPCHRLNDSPATCVPNASKNGAACISDISVDQILETVKEKLHG